MNARRLTLSEGYYYPGLPLWRSVRQGSAGFVEEIRGLCS